MRTIAGLIVGLGLGILLTYFTVSTARVQGLRTQPPQRSETGQPAQAGAAGPTALAEGLGEAAAQAVLKDLREDGKVLVVDSGGGPAAAAAAGFRRALGAVPGRPQVAAASVSEAMPLLAGADRVFCADHGRLRELLEQADGRALAPLYTVGWSQWLLTVCARADSPIAGVAVADPAGAVRVLTVCQDQTAESASAEVQAVVLAPAQVTAAFGPPGGTASPLSAP